MRVGGIYNARMEAKDGSFGFDFNAIYTEVSLGNNFTYGMADRMVNVQFIEQGTDTEVIVTFDAENENPLDLQQAGWQAILNNFKNYTEHN